MPNAFALVSLATVLLLAGIGMGQESPPQISPQVGRTAPTITPATPAAEKPSWLPKDKYPTIDLSTLSYARASADQKNIQILKPAINTETFTKVVTVEGCRSETRQRTVKVDGKDEVQDFVVKVPFTNTVEVPYTAAVAAGVRKLDLRLDQVRAWELSGKELSSAELFKRLVKPTQVLVQELRAEELAKFKFQPVESFFGGVIKLDTIAVYCPQEEPKPSE